MNSKKIYLLIGKKGSGKSYIGQLLDKHFGIKFIRVEDLAKEIKKNRNINNESYLYEVFGAIEQNIRNELTVNESIIFESTGLTEQFDSMLDNLQKNYKVITVKINADDMICFQRVKTRDQSIHVNISDDMVEAINRMVDAKNMKTDFEIDNNHNDSGKIISEFKEIMKLQKLI